MAKVRFSVQLIGSGPRGTWYMITLPSEVHTALGGNKGRIAITGTADAHPIRTSAVPMGGVHCFVFNKEMQAATGKTAGDTVTFILEPDTKVRTVSLPADLRKAFASNEKAKEKFNALSYTHRKEYVRWIEEAKRPETRARRIAQALVQLVKRTKRGGPLDP